MRPSATRRAGPRDIGRVATQCGAVDKPDARVVTAAVLLGHRTRVGALLQHDDVAVGDAPRAAAGQARTAIAKRETRKLVRRITDKPLVSDPCQGPIGSRSRPSVNAVSDHGNRSGPWSDTTARRICSKRSSIGRPGRDGLARTGLWPDSELRPNGSSCACTRCHAQDATRSLWQDSTSRLRAPVGVGSTTR